MGKSDVAKAKKTGFPYIAKERVVFMGKRIWKYLSGASTLFFLIVLLLSIILSKSITIIEGIVVSPDLINYFVLPYLIVICLAVFLCSQHDGLVSFFKFTQRKFSSKHREAYEEEEFVLNILELQNEINNLSKTLGRCMVQHNVGADAMMGGPNWPSIEIVQLRKVFDRLGISNPGGKGNAENDYNYFSDWYYFLKTILTCMRIKNYKEVKTAYQHNLQ